MAHVALAVTPTIFVVHTMHPGPLARPQAVMALSLGAAVILVALPPAESHADQLPAVRARHQFHDIHESPWAPSFDFAVQPTQTIRSVGIPSLEQIGTAWVS